MSEQMPETTTATGSPKGTEKRTALQRLNASYFQNDGDYSGTLLLDPASDISASEIWTVLADGADELESRLTEKTVTVTGQANRTRTGFVLTVQRGSYITADFLSEVSKIAGTRYTARARAEARITTRPSDKMPNGIIVTMYVEDGVPSTAKLTAKDVKDVRNVRLSGSSVAFSLPKTKVDAAFREGSEAVQTLVDNTVKEVADFLGYHVTRPVYVAGLDSDAFLIDGYFED